MAVAYTLAAGQLGNGKPQGGAKKKPSKAVVGGAAAGVIMN